MSDYDFLDDDEQNEGKNMKRKESKEEEEIGGSEVPAHSCFYCGYSNINSVVQCGHSGCGKWFCNGRSGTCASHIVHHLVKSKHKEISLHPQNPLGDTVLECYICGSRNVFSLGFVSSKKDSVVVLLCREPCLHSNKLDELEWNTSKWIPLISDRQFLPWLVRVPDEKEMSRTRHVTTNMVNKIEDMLKTNPYVTMEALEIPSDREDDLIPVPFVYPDGYRYRNILTPLIKLEAQFDKDLKESQCLKNQRVDWDPLKKKRRNFRFPSPKSDSNFRLVPGDELRIVEGNHSSTEKDVWKADGNVIKIDVEYVYVELKNRKSSSPKDKDGLFRIEFVWKSTSFDRMISALNLLSFNESCTTSYLYHRLLGHPLEVKQIKAALPKTYAGPNLPDLNHSQVLAVKNVLQNPLTLIQGPPGTGKTVTGATICYHLVKQRTGQVLVCAPSNVAVDQFAEKIHKTGAKVVRLCAKSREAVECPVEFLTVHYLLNKVEGFDEYQRLKKKKRMTDGEGLSISEEKKFRVEKRKAEREILRAADVICCTCVGAGDPRLNGFKFRHVIIDESTQACEPECLIPIVKGAKQLALIGDHCQLGPVIMCKKAAKAGLGRSLFERLVMLGIRPVRLQVQYRMHPCLSEFPSNTFYEGTLQNGVTTTDRLITNITFPWPVPSKPMFFYNSLGEEEFSSSGTSYLNRIEAQLVEKVVSCLLKAGVVPHQLGVVTPYEGQRSFVIKHMQRSGSLRTELYKAIEVASVDSFQGREKDFIILSCVRSNSHKGIGFLNDPRRLNVALSRSRCGLIVIGNAKVLAHHPLWNLLLNHFQKNDLVVEGPLNHLKQTTLSFQKPKNFYKFRHGIGYGLANSVPFQQRTQNHPSLMMGGGGMGMMNHPGSFRDGRDDDDDDSDEENDSDDEYIRPKIPEGYNPGETLPASSFMSEEELNYSERRRRNENDSRRGGGERRKTNRNNHYY